MIAGSRRRAPVTAAAVDRDRGYVALANPIDRPRTDPLPIDRDRDRSSRGTWKSCRAATECDHRHHQRSGPANSARSTTRTQNRRARRTAEPACSTTSRTRRFARAAERRAAPVPDVACARRWIAFATGAGTRPSTTGVSPDLRHALYGGWRDALATRSSRRARYGRDTFSPPICGRGRSRAQCSTSTSRSGGALRCEQLQHTNRRRNFRWCSPPPQLVTS